MGGTKKESKDKIINLSLLKKVCLEIADVYAKYNLNPHDRGLVIREMHRFSALEEKEIEKKVKVPTDSGIRVIDFRGKGKKKYYTERIIDIFFNDNKELK
ncbi:hypothetical protein LCGC14_2655200, partial [marine sediment metagenome]